MTSTRRLLAAAAPALAALVVAPGAHAAAIIGLKPCYVSVDPDEREHLGSGVWAVGYDPNAEVDVTVGEKTRTGVANGHGNVDLRRSVAPYQRRGQAPFTVTVAQLATPFYIASAQSMVTALSVRLRPARAATSQRIRFRGRGFTAPRPIWGHYLFHDHVKKTVRFARLPSGVCGRFSVRRRQIPLRHPRPGRWTLQVDQRHRYSPEPVASVYFRVQIDVSRRPRSR